MNRDDLGGRIMAHAFNDELEKIAGLPREVAKGGGGAVGAAMRGRARQGREVASGLKTMKTGGPMPKKLGWNTTLKPAQEAPAAHALKYRSRGGEMAQTLNKRLSDMPGQTTPRGAQLRTDPRAAL